MYRILEIIKYHRLCDTSCFHLTFILLLDLTTSIAFVIFGGVVSVATTLIASSTTLQR